jgi:hypothetical protein
MSTVSQTEQQYPSWLTSYGIRNGGAGAILNRLARAVNYVAPVLGIYFVMMASGSGLPHRNTINVIGLLWMAIWSLHAIATICSRVKAKIAFIIMWAFIGNAALLATIIWLTSQLI